MVLAIELPWMELEDIFPKVYLMCKLSFGVFLDWVELTSLCMQLVSPLCSVIILLLFIVSSNLPSSSHHLQSIHLSFAHLLFQTMAMSLELLKTLNNGAHIGREKMSLLRCTTDRLIDGVLLVESESRSHGHSY